MAELIFEEPPEVHGRNGIQPGDGEIGQWLDALRSHPGEWAKFPRHLSASTGTFIRKATAYGVRFPGEFEVRGRKVDEPARNRQWIYCRYIGGES